MITRNQDYISQGRTMRASIIIPLLLSLLLLPQARADQPLADKVPADAIMYVGWAGADAVKPAYDQSHLAAVVNASNVPQLIDEYLPQLWQHMNDAQAQKALTILWHHPSAWFLEPPVAAGLRQMNFRIGLICDAGDDAAALTQALRAQGPRALGPNTRVTASGNVITMYAGAAPPAGGLVTVPIFADAATHLQKDAPAISFFVNGKVFLDTLNASAAQDPQARVLWPKVREALGITNAQCFATTLGFDGKDWTRSGVLAIPGPRTGIPAAIEPHPIDPDLLARVPANVNSLSVVNFDGTKFVDSLHDAFTAAGGEKQFNMGMGALTAMLGRNFRTQLLSSLGPQWVTYATDQSAGPVMMNKLADPKVAQDALVSALYGISNLVNTQLGPRGGPPLTTPSQTQDSGLTITTVTVKQFAPSFTVKDGILYVGMTPAAVTAAANAPAPGATAMQHQNFTAAQQRLGVQTIAGFSYANLPATAPGAYSVVTAGIQSLHDLGNSVGVPMPELKLPPLDVLKDQLSPSLSATWADDSGIYAKSISPFPFSAALLGDSQSAVTASAATAAVTAVLMPALNRSRETAKRVQCASNIRQISMGILMYANDHKGEYPPDLGTLVTSGPLAIDLFVCPLTKNQIPPEIRNAPKAQQATWVNEHSDYIYHGKGLNTRKAAAMTPVISEREGAATTVGENIGFGDGHVEWVLPAQAKKLLGNAPDAGEQGL
jgi:hypothetical protein